MDKVSIIGDAARYVKELQKDVDEGEADIKTLVAIMQRAITSQCGENIGERRVDPLTFPLPMDNASLENVYFQTCEITKVISISLSPFYFICLFFSFIFDDWVHILFCNRLSHRANLALEDINIYFFLSPTYNLSIYESFNL